MRHALRSLLQSPGYAILAVVALALALGANTILFSSINTLFLRPLPYPDSDRLLRLWSKFPERGLEKTNLSWSRYETFADQQRVFSHFAAHSFTAFTLTGRGEPEQLPGMRVTGDFFPTLGIQPRLGRNFSSAEEADGGANVVLVSHGFWVRRLGGRPDAIGQTLDLNGVPYTVIGVLPSTFGFPWQQTQIWAPRVFEQEGLPRDLIEKGTGYLFFLGRLKPGISVAAAREQLLVVNARYEAAHPEKVDAHTGLVVIPWLEDLVGNQRPMFLTLLAAVGCVLLVACSNVANLLLARFTSQRKDTAIRLALGASRRRIILQFLSESVLLAAVGGGLGVLFATWGQPLLARIGANFAPRLAEVRLDWRVLGFAIALSLITGVILGIIPAIQASRTDAGESLKDCSRGSSAGRHRGRMRSILLVAEVAISLVLLVGASLLVDSFRRLQLVDPGFRSDQITTFFLGLPDATYGTVDRQSRFFQALVGKLAAIPGVTAVAAGSSLPIAAGGFTRSPAAVEGRPLPEVSDRPLPLRSTISPGWLSTLGIRIEQGRDFTWRDRSDQPNVVIINQTLARMLFPHENPIGRRLITGITSVPREIVGVASDVRSESLALTPAPEMYYPAAQIDGQFLSLALRSARPAGSLRPEIAAAVHSLDPGLPIGDVQSLNELLAQAVSDRRLSMWLLAGFAVVALTLAAMGLYSVIAYGVAQRTTEFGIRLALGAAPSLVVTMVLREGLRLTCVGLVLGLVLSLAAARLMQNLLYDVSATDPVLLGGAVAFLTGIASVACLVPALAATRVDPVDALRAE